MFGTKGVLLSNSANVQCMKRLLSNNVGFIGVGQMGRHMVNNLLKKGHKLTVYDTTKEALEPFKSSGVKIAASASEVASQNDFVVTMLPNNDIVLDSYLGKDGILAGARPGTLLVDSSTIDPDVAKTVSAKATEKGTKFLDAPVSGGVVGAEAATLTFMVGGEKQVFDQVHDYLTAMGSRAVHCGGPGMGQVAKLSNNMLLAISMIGVSEAMNLGIRLGLDAKLLMDIINTSTGRCWSSEVYNPVPNLVPNVPPSNDYKGGFTVKLISKDLGLAQNLATKSGTPIPLGSLAHQIYRLLANREYADLDFGVIYKYLKQ